MMTSAQAGKHSPMLLTLLRITVTKMKTLKWWYSIHTLVSWKADLFLQTWVVLTLFFLQNHRLQKVNRNSNLHTGLMTRTMLQISLIGNLHQEVTWSMLHSNNELESCWCQKLTEKMHLREIFYGTLIFQQSSMICIGRHVGGHTVALHHSGQNYFFLVSC